MLRNRKRDDVAYRAHQMAITSGFILAAYFSYFSRIDKEILTRGEEILQSSCIIYRRGVLPSLPSRERMVNGERDFPSPSLSLIDVVAKERMWPVVVAAI